MAVTESDRANGTDDVSAAFERSRAALAALYDAWLEGEESLGLAAAALEFNHANTALNQMLQGEGTEPPA
jgi:hypothetical protein